MAALPGQHGGHRDRAAGQAEQHVDHVVMLEVHRAEAHQRGQLPSGPRHRPSRDTHPALASVGERGRNVIRKQDVLDRAAEWNLRPEVVEKDYVLGWILAGLSAVPSRATWIFKGGTSIKKCFFETYRFSEDLDFSLLPNAGYTDAEVRQVLLAITEKATEFSGIQFPADLIEVRTRQNRQQELTFEGRIAYNGPLAHPGPPRVRFDLTRHEPVLDEPTARNILHPYPDPLPEGSSILTYSFNEMLAEKTRALYERSRPRDLYDVVFLLENRPDAFDLMRVRDLFAGKCRSKSLSIPTAARLFEILTGADELRSEWVSMLGHQLPTLPGLDDLLRRTPGLIAWLDGPATVFPEATLAAAQYGAETTLVAPAGIQYWGGGLPLETVRFAGANRLLIEFEYSGKYRVAEPYSLRQARTGNLLLYAWEEGSTHIKAFIAADMRGVRATDRNFTPRYRVEFSADAPLSIPGAHSPGIRSAWPGASPRRGSSRRRAFSGTAYVFECPHCQRRFTHTSNDPTLRQHKRKDGYSKCSGRRGHLVAQR